MAIEQLQEGLMSSFGAVASDIRSFIKEKPLTSAVAAGGIVAVTAGGIIAATRNGKKRKKTTRRKARTKKGRSRDRKFISKQKHEIRRRRKRKPAKIYKKKGRYWRRKPLTKSNSKRVGRVGKIFYTKKGQPYVKNRKGQARFIKKRKGRR